MVSPSSALCAASMAAALTRAAAPGAGGDCCVAVAGAARGVRSEQVKGAGERLFRADEARRQLRARVLQRGPVRQPQRAPQRAARRCWLRLQAHLQPTDTLTLLAFVCPSIIVDIDLLRPPQHEVQMLWLQLLQQDDG